MNGQIIVPGFGDMTQDVIRELTSGRLFQEVQARREAKAIAVEEHQAGGRRHLKCGRLRMRISEESYFYWGMRLGWDCWKDPQFLREYERDNPECRVRSRSARTSVRVTSDEWRVTRAKGNCLPANNSISRDSAARNAGEAHRGQTAVGLPANNLPRGTILDRTGAVAT